MEKETLKNILVLSALCGVALAFLALLPVIVKLSVFLLMSCVSVIVILLLQRAGALKIFTVKESLTVGAVCGFVSYIVFSLIYLPLVYLLSLVVPIGYLGGFVLMLKLSNFALILMFTIFISIVSVLFNSFTSLVYFYLMSSIGSFKDNIKGK